MPSISLTVLLGELEGQDMLLGLALVGVGLVFVIFGARIFKPLIILSFLVVGFVFGMALPVTLVAQLLTGIVAAIGLAVVSKFYPQLSVALLAGGWAALVVTIVACYLGASDRIAMVLGGFSLAVTVSLGFVVQYEVAAAVLSFQGTLLMAGGLVIYLSHHAATWRHLRTIILENPPFLAFLLLAGTVTGYYLQVAEAQKKAIGTSA